MTEIIMNHMQPMSNISNGLYHRSLGSGPFLENLILQFCGTCHLLGAGFYFSMFQTLILVLNIKALQILFGHYKLEEPYLAGKNKCWIYQEKILFFCRTQGGVYIHSDRLTVTSPVLMWVKVWTNFIWINFFLAVTGMKVYCEQ